MRSEFSSSVEQMERTCYYTIQSLCLMGYRDPDQIAARFKEALEDVALGRLLLRKGLLNKEELLDSIEESLASGRLLSHVLVRAGYCSLREMMGILAEKEEEP
ncbi:MAG TPA: hypothetical protein V6C82_06780 [Chroococcales cyanobacterium]